jgi:ring-1,2-phenylacetyl-CoA epoxidase subunit PaaD
VRAIKTENDSVEIVITPTYTGCPAMDMIAMNIKLGLLENNIANFKITTTLSPAWTTDWMTDAGKKKLEEYGIAPPKKSIELDAVIKCPQCNSTNTFLISQFGSTACKALYKCNHCLEPFDYFKCY